MAVPARDGTAPEPPHCAEGASHSFFPIVFFFSLFHFFSTFFFGLSLGHEHVHRGLYGRLYLDLFKQKSSHERFNNHILTIFDTLDHGCCFFPCVKHCVILCVCAGASVSQLMRHDPSLSENDPDPLCRGSWPKPSPSTSSISRHPCNPLAHLSGRVCRVWQQLVLRPV